MIQKSVNDASFVSLVIQSFEEAAQAVELVQPSAFVFDAVFSSWALRLRESDRFPSIGLYLLLLGDPCSTSHAAADCKVLACWTKKTLSLFGLIELNSVDLTMTLCTYLLVTFIYTWLFLSWTYWFSCVR